MVERLGIGASGMRRVLLAGATLSTVTWVLGGSAAALAADGPTLQGSQFAMNFKPPLLDCTTGPGSTFTGTSTASIPSALGGTLKVTLSVTLGALEPDVIVPGPTWDQQFPQGRVIDASIEATLQDAAGSATITMTPRLDDPAATFGWCADYEHVDFSAGGQYPQPTDLSGHYVRAELPFTYTAEFLEPDNGDADEADQLWKESGVGSLGLSEDFRKPPTGAETTQGGGYIVFQPKSSTPVDIQKPKVKGVADPGPNAAGWNRTPVTITWTATDPWYSSGAVSDPDPTIADTEGLDVLYKSDPVCDPAGNCARGKKRISIDMTPPQLNGGLTFEPAHPVVGGPMKARLKGVDQLSGLDRGQWWEDGDHHPMDLDGGGGVLGDLGGLSAGPHTIHARLVDLAGNWTEPVSGEVIVIDLPTPQPCSLRQDRTEADWTFHVIREQARPWGESVLPCAGIPVDIRTPGAYGPTEKSSLALSPGTIPDTAAVRSYLVHVDRLTSEAGTWLKRTVVLHFTGGTVEGIALRDATLDATDGLAAYGTLMPTGLFQRGQEVNIQGASKGTWLNKDDTISLSADRSTVTISLQTGEVMDQVRIITSKDAELAPDSTGFHRVDPPPSLRQDAFDTEQCIAAKQKPKDTCRTPGAATGADLDDDVVVILEQTSGVIELGAPLVADIDPASADTAWTRTHRSNDPVTIPAGTQVRSVLIHVDREGPFTSATAPQTMTHTFAFDHDILGVVTSDARLDASDKLVGTPWRTYPTGWALRGLDFGQPDDAGSDELVRIVDARHLELRMDTAERMDEVRVILAP